MAFTYQRHPLFLLPLLLHLLLLLLLFHLPHATSTPVYVVTTTGVLEGTQDTSPDGHPYFAFRGIPFALPPVGERRWKLPVPWPGFGDQVYQATAFKPACPQDDRIEVTDEDCLYLDVYLPVNVTTVFHNVSEAWRVWEEEEEERRNNQTTASPVDADSGGGLPVMVWIHGGSFTAGSSSMNEAWKMATEQEIVVAVIQYRLGALGFLSSGSPELPGNYGLWDQRLALLWVHDNIRGFGGDAAMVTAAGESAGSASVSFQTLSPQATGLFQRAVMMSGTADAKWTFNPDPRDTFDRFSRQAGCGGSTTSISSLLSCLMTLPADVIFNTYVATAAGGVNTILPTIDGDFFKDDVKRLLEDEDYLASVGFYDYDFLVGTVNNEAVVLFGSLVAIVPSVLDTGRVPYMVVDGIVVGLVVADQQGPRHGLTIVDVVNHEYFYPRVPGEVTVPVRQVLDVFSDTTFIVPTVKTARRHAQRSSAAGAPSGSATGSGKSYMYFFDWIPSLTEGTMFEGVPHALDVDYLWGLTNDSLLLYGTLPLGGSILPREHVVSRMFGDMVGAFVRTGDPNSGLPVNVRNQWSPYDVTNETFLRFSLTPSIDHHLHGHRVSLWVDLVPRLHSRWLNETAATPRPNTTQSSSASDSTTAATPRPDTTQSSSASDSTTASTGDQALTYFDLSESETNALLVSLLVVCVVLLLFCVFLLARLMMVYRRRGKMDGGE